MRSTVNTGIARLLLFVVYLSGMLFNLYLIIVFSIVANVDTITLSDERIHPSLDFNALFWSYIGVWGFVGLFQLILRWRQAEQPVAWVALWLVCYSISALAFWLVDRLRYLESGSWALGVGAAIVAAIIGWVGPTLLRRQLARLQAGWWLMINGSTMLALLLIWHPADNAVSWVILALALGAGGGYLAATLLRRTIEVHT